MNAWHQGLSRADRWLLGRWAAEPTSAQRKARMISGFAASVVVISLAFVPLAPYSTNDPAKLRAAVLIGAAAFSLLIVWVRKGNSLVGPSVVFLVMGGAFSAYSSGITLGALAMSSPWLAVTVLLAAYLLGSRAAVLTGLGLCGLYVLVWWLERAGLIHPVEPHPQLSTHVMPSVLLSLVTACWMSIFYRRILDQEAAEKLKVELELKRAQRLESLGQLVAGIAHEINNPLTFIISNVGFVKRQLDSPDALRANQEDCRDALRDAAEGADRVRRIVADLKAFSRETEDELEWVQLQELVDFTLKLSGNLVKHVATVKLDVPAQLQVRAPRVRLGQVLLNLVTNAAQAIAPGHQQANLIEVRAFMHQEGCVIEVSDTGHGIAPEHQERVFEPFFTTKGVGTGTGLGLSVSLGVVQKLGGELTLEPRPGGGTVARITLPEARTVAPASVAAAPGVAPPPPRLRVLVVDDEPAIARVVARSLKGAEVVGEVEAQQALERCRREQFDLVLCDLMMPRMCGDEFFQKLSELWPDAAGKVVFITGGALSEESGRFLEQHPYLQKPFDDAALKQLARQHAAKKAA